MLGMIFQMLRKKHKRGRRNASPLYSLGVKFGVLTVALTLAIIISFSVFDSFSFYYWYLFSENSDREFRDGQSATQSSYSDWFAESFKEKPVKDNTTSGSGLVGSPSTTPGYTGVTGMYINQMESGYIQEMLTIVKNHCNWSMMHPECDDNEWEQDDGSTVTLYPRITSVLGGLLAESGITSDSLLKTLLPAENWGTNENLTLSNYNSIYLANVPSAPLASGIDRATLKSGGYYTHWQFGYGYMYRYPNGTNSARANTYPSAMTGYGVTSGVRERADTDAAYFPDQVAVYIQNTFGAVWDYFEESMLTQDDIAVASYPLWNGGNTRIRFTWASGGHYNNGRKFPWIFDNDIGAEPTMPAANPKQSIQASAAVNKVTAAVMECLEYLYDHSDLLEDSDDWAEHNLYTGMAVTAMLLDGGFIASQTCFDRLQNKISDSETPFMKGAWLAYLAHTSSGLGETGETEPEAIATIKDVAAYLRTVELTPLDQSFYGAPYEGKSGDVAEIVVHMYNSAYQVYNGDGVGPRDLVHAFNQESLRGSFMSVIGGTYAYWNMLTLTGIELTVEQASNDATGLRVEDITILEVDPTTGEISKAPANSYYYGTRAFSSFLYNQVGFSKVSSPIYYRDLEGLRGSVGVHVGEDFSTGLGNDLYGQDLAAMTDAKIVEMGVVSGYGRTMVLEVVEARSVGTTKRMQYRYAHMYSFAEGLEVGSYVTQGQKVGVSGGSGTSGGSLALKAYSVHLHMTFTVEEKSATGRYTMFVIPAGGVFQGACTVATSPRMAYIKKDCPAGQCIVYDHYMNPKGCMIEKQFELYGSGTKKDGWWVKHGYYGIGPWLNIG